MVTQIDLIPLCRQCWPEPLLTDIAIYAIILRKKRRRRKARDRLILSRGFERRREMYPLEFMLRQAQHEGLF